MVSLVDGAQLYHFCGGSIISDEWVVTAAHCAVGMSNSDWVLYGDHNLYITSDAAAMATNIAEIKIHPDYNSNTYDNDIALLKLANAIEFPDDNRIAPVCLPTAGEMYANVDATITGWGAQEQGGSTSAVLYEVTVPTMTNAACDTMYSGQITANMICAGVPEGGKDSCQGDSGGPMIVEENGKWKLVGVVSWGYGCAQPNSPGVYARVTQYLNWISESTTGVCSIDTSPVPPTPTSPPPPPPTPEPTSPSDCPECGLVNRATRIVGGFETEVNEYPWMVSLVDGAQLYHFCGGSIISDEWVVTAAHCAVGMSNSDWVLYGDHNLYITSDAAAMATNIAEIKIHPDYNSNTYDNDIALLKLANAIEFPDDNRIAPVCLPTVGEMYANVDATITGWGAQEQGGSTSAVLYEVTVPTMTNAACDTMYSGQITANMICAGVPEGGKDSCQGDSGGPMIVEENGKWKLVGVVSWGYGCAQPNSPGVYARVTQYLNWISESTTGVCSIDTSPAPPTPTSPPPPPPTPEPTSPSDCPECGLVNRATRIVGGFETEVNEYPWMVSLVNGAQLYHFCGGSIISDEWVVTAAHCAVGMSNSDWVLYGDHNLYITSDAAAMATNIAEIKIHPDYNSNTYDNDIALLKLANAIEFPDDNRIAPVCLPTAGEMYANVDATITGWGAQEQGGSTSAVLYEVTVPTMTNAACDTMYSGQITANMICAGVPEGGKDSCQGDSGGPMIVEENGKWKLVGVVSWGYGCAQPNSPGVYARVTQYLNWISESTTGVCSIDTSPAPPTPTSPPPPPPTPEPTSPSDCPECGLVNRATRIVGGFETEVNEYPWMVSLVDGAQLYHFCGGSIISDEWVVTAAHCAVGMSNSDWVLYGDHNLYITSDAAAMATNIAEIKIHPDYNSNTYDNDIALLKLANAIEFPDDNRIAPVCLPTAGEMYANVDATITGWGAQEQGGSTSAVLYEVTVPTMTNAACDTMYSGQITANMICAGVPEGGKDSCQGDSGGPMIVEENGKWKLVGVVSWGYGCAQPNSPGVYARVTQYLNWISESTTGVCSIDTSPAPPNPTSPPPPPPTPEPTSPSDCPECGLVNRATRIVGGFETEVNEYPWMVSLVNGAQLYHFCGGSIISDEWVVTAAHCAVGMSNSDWVLYGDHNLYITSDAAAMATNIAEIKIHPDYNSNTYDNDIALLKLANAIEFPDDNRIAPVCLPTAGEMYANVDATITGWGAQEQGGSTSAVLYEVTVPTMTNAACDTMYSGQITANMICAGVPEGGKDSCQGDSGGPMVVEENGKWKLVGVVSWGYGCAQPNSPGVYARVTKYLDWIATSTGGICTT
ncbi:transmembrane protease serine 9-like isoform X2 [Penaeus monodon]|uniref:transmembrane protease serine 9-like isoform X2 n=1 Tax=Penaeus monodon TaxID=6687 RepID=UPI0018A7D3A9|nr:transmembrane protease serine 9-like isoform X2 [Penaeus monodon]